MHPHGKAVSLSGHSALSPAQSNEESTCRKCSQGDSFTWVLSRPLSSRIQTFSISPSCHPVRKNKCLSVYSDCGYSTGVYFESEYLSVNTLRVCVLDVTNLSVCTLTMGKLGVGTLCGYSGHAYSGCVSFEYM